MNDTPRGILKISTPVSVGSCRLITFVTAFLRQYPDIDIDLHLTDRFVDLMEQGFEMTLRIGPLEVSSLIRQLLYGSDYPRPLEKMLVG